MAKRQQYVILSFTQYTHTLLYFKGHFMGELGGALRPEKGVFKGYSKGPAQELACGSTMFLTNCLARLDGWPTRAWKLEFAGCGR